MKRLIKNADVILDGTATRAEKEREAFKKLELIETILFEGVFIRRSQRIIHCAVRGVNIDGIIVINPYCHQYEPTYDHQYKWEEKGRLWGLTKEELE